MPELTTKHLMRLCAYYQDKEGKPLLEGVREPCFVQYVEPGSYIGDTAHPLECHGCHGLGWTPAEDVWKWLHNLCGDCAEYLEEYAVSLLLAAAEGPDTFFAVLSFTLRPLAVNIAP